jgi:dTDP-4-dehydrorhamnose 3,5-epimerase
VILRETEIERVCIVEPQPLEDARGFFARTWDTREFAERGLNGSLVQCSISFNPVAGTLRGLHWQAPPHEEAKLIRCTRGAIFDVAVDLRSNSPTFKRWVAVELSAENRLGLYIPEGCAHGFLTQTDDAEVLYLISQFHEPAAARGVRWDDPAFAIEWPTAVVVINERDRTYSDFEAKPE